MTRLVSLALLLLVASPSHGSPIAASDTLEPTELRLDFAPVGATLSLGVRAVGQPPLPLPLGGRVGLTLGACDAGGTCPITAVEHLGPSGDLFPPVPLTVANVPICLRVRPNRAVGSTSLATGAIDVAVPAIVGMHLTSIDAVCPTCDAGRCTGGEFPDAPCFEEARATVPDGAGGTRVAQLSRDCPPEGSPSGAFPMTLSLTTASPDPGPGCPGTLDPSPGSTTTPLPALPDPSLPKTAATTLVGGGCAGATGIITVDVVYGLPGPMSLRLPAGATWTADPDPTFDVTVLGRHVHVTCTFPTPGHRGELCEAFAGDATGRVATRGGRRGFGGRAGASVVLRLDETARAELRATHRLDLAVYARVRNASASVPMALVGTAALVR